MTPASAVVVAKDSGVEPEMRRVVSARARPPHASGLLRERLRLALEGIWRHRLTLVVAPAGSGKTTTLAQFAATVDCPVAWYRAESGDTDEATALAYLESALSRACPSLARGWRDVEDAAAALEAWSGDRLLLVVDDLHEIDGTAALETLMRLVNYAAPPLSAVAAARADPTTNLSRLVVEGALLEIGSDDLRFRAWEVEQLFREYYGELVPPEDLAELARRTEGWAAGLQLFHLATRGRRPDERRAMLHALGVQGRLGRQYLADNVLQHLPADLCSFLVESSVLGRLSGPLCDNLLGRVDSREVLADLERRRLFTIEVGDGWYRYHEVLRSHLEASLVERFGEHEARTRFRLAAELLEAAGLPGEALHAYCRAEDWGAVRRVLGSEGAALAAAHNTRLELLPPSLRHQDPWVGLAFARRLRAEGRWSSAVRAYRRVETLLPPPATDIARIERQALALWLAPPFEQRGDWNGLLRAATVRDPMAVVADAATLSRPWDVVIPGLASLLAGRMDEARSLLDDAGREQDASPLLSAVSQLAAGVAALLAGDGDAALDVEWAALEAERLGMDWLAQIGHGLLVLMRPDAGEPTALDQFRSRCDDPWGAGLATLLEGFGALHRSGSARAIDPAELTGAAASFRDLGANTLGVWCDAVAALVGVRGGMGSPETAQTALRRARQVGVPGAEALATLAAAEADPQPAGSQRAAAEELLATCGLRALSAPQGESRSDGIPSLRIRCFGRFELCADGEPVDLSGLKPRARSLLRLLALHANEPLHREVIVATLWPDADPDSGTRSLHVALSGLRQAVEPNAPRGASSVIERDGESYRLVVASDAADTLRFERALGAGAAAAARGDATGAVTALREALDLYRGELLPAEGPAEWVVDDRNRYRLKAAEASEDLAVLLAERGDLTGATAACEQTLRWDPYRDTTWQLLIRIQESAGNPAAATMVRRHYAALLESLEADC